MLHVTPVSNGKLIMAKDFLHKAGRSPVNTSYQDSDDNKTGDETGTDGLFIVLHIKKAGDTYNDIIWNDDLDGWFGAGFTNDIISP